MTSTSTLSDYCLRDKPGRRSRPLRLTLMAATAVATTLIPNNAQAVLNIYLFDDTNGNLTIESRGTLNLGTPPGGGVICTAAQPSAQIKAYSINATQTKLLTP